MSSTSSTLVDDRRAAVLLGISYADIRMLSRQAGIGHVSTESGATAADGCAERIVFTYDELHRLCLLAARPRS